MELVSCSKIVVNIAIEKLILTSKRLIWAYYNLTKASLLRVYIAIHMCIVMFIKKTSIFPCVVSEFEFLWVTSLNIGRSSNPFNIKKGVTAIYYMNTLPLKVLKFLYRRLSYFKVRRGGKICNSIFFVIVQSML